MRIKVKHCFLLVLAVLPPLSGCKALEFLQQLDRLSRAPDPFEGMQFQSGPQWSVHPDNPVVRAGDHRDKGLWNDPSVLKVNGEYIMYMTSSTGEPFKPPVLPFRAVSRDGVRWRLSPSGPLLSLAGTPFVSIETPSVVRYRGRYHMYYTGIYPEGSEPPMAIGHATSQDGIHWVSDSKPLITATGNASNWNGYLVGEPGAVVFNDRLHVYFSAVGARASGTPPQEQTIGLAVSSDGTRFTRPVKVLMQAPLYPPEKGFAGYSTPAALVFDGRMHLFYDVAFFHARANPQWQQVALHHAWSSNGRDFIQDRAPLFTRNSFSWSGGEILAPSALVDDGRIRLWFAGHVAVDKLAPMVHRGWKGGEFGIGHASISVDRFLEALR